MPVVFRSPSSPVTVAGAAPVSHRLPYSHARDRTPVCSIRNVRNAPPPAGVSLAGFERQLRLETGAIAPEREHGDLRALGEVGHRRVALLERAVDLQRVERLGVADPVEREIVL